MCVAHPRPADNLPVGEREGGRVNSDPCILDRRGTTCRTCITRAREFRVRLLVPGLPPFWTTAREL